MSRCTVPRKAVVVVAVSLAAVTIVDGYHPHYWPPLDHVPEAGVFYPIHETPVSAITSNGSNGTAYAQVATGYGAAHTIGAAIKTAA